VFAKEQNGLRHLRNSVGMKAAYATISSLWTSFVPAVGRTVSARRDLCIDKSMKREARTLSIRKVAQVMLCLLNKDEGESGGVTSLTT